LNFGLHVLFETFVIGVMHMIVPPRKPYCWVLKFLGYGGVPHAPYVSINELPPTPPIELFRAQVDVRGDGLFLLS